MLKFHVMGISENKTERKRKEKKKMENGKEKQTSSRERKLLALFL